MRRELQAFEARLTGISDSSSPEFRKRLLDAHAARTEGGKLVFNAPSEDETFDQMRIRITKRIQLPMWPGVVSGLLGFVFLVASIATPNDTNNARQSASNN